MGHPPLNLNPGGGHLTKLEGVVGWGKNSLGYILANLVLINIKGSHEIDITDMIPAEINVHQPGNKFVIFGFLIVVNALNQGGGAVAHPYYCYIYLAQS
ncbi:hypothetical protein ES708_24525 [subsurface metagenome]